MGYLTHKYIETTYLGWLSHWKQPWRSYLETWPVTRFVSGIAINSFLENNPDLQARHLKENGFHIVRIEIPWGNADFETEEINKDVRNELAISGCAKHGLRPLILLNSHHGEPGPHLDFNRTLTSAVSQGDTVATLNNTSGIIPNYTGFSDVTEYLACQVLITAVSGNTVYTAKPFPKNLASGTTVKMTTWKYRPCGPTDSEEYNGFYHGWQMYASGIHQIMKKYGIKEYDVEIWNELTFGSNYLDVNNYYTSGYYQQNSNPQGCLHRATTQFYNTDEEEYGKIRVSTGFSNQRPWDTPATINNSRIYAMGKHPYQGKGSGLNYSSAGSDIDGITTTYNPKYIWFFPEFFLNLLQPETLIRDMSPIINYWFGTPHGRYCKNELGESGDIVITENNMAPSTGDSNVTVDQALYSKAKIALRFLTSYLNKGAGLFAFYNDSGGDKTWGMVSDGFFSYINTYKSYPEDESLTSPALKAIRNTVKEFKKNVDYSLTLKTCRQFDVIQIFDTHDNYQFLGSGGLGSSTPTMYNRDVFAFFPYQSNNNKFVIPYYVMTRNMFQVYNPSGGIYKYDLPEEEYFLTVSGFVGKASFTVYDPITDSTILNGIPSIDNNGFYTFRLMATDYPRLLIVEDTKDKKETDFRISPDKKQNFGGVSHKSLVHIDSTKANDSKSLRVSDIITYKNDGTPSIIENRAYKISQNGLNKASFSRGR